MTRNTNFATVIDTLAISSCSKLNKTETKKFFSHIRKRQKTGDSAPRKYPMRDTYYKGARKGQIKDVFEIDGRMFNKLWDTVAPYAYKSTFKSIEHFKEDLEDVVGEIRIQLFYILRFFGPTPNGQPLSTYVKLITNNVLTTAKRRRSIKTSYHATSLSSPVGHSEEGDEIVLGDTLICATIPDFDIFANIDKDVLPLVEAALGNDFDKTASSLGLTRKQAKAKLQTMLQ